MKRALVGTEVRCWDCHRMVMVPVPGTTGLVAEGLVEGIAGVFKADVLASIGVGAAVVTALLFAANGGVPWAAAAAMAVLAAGYGELIRRSGQDPRDQAGDEAEGEHAPPPPPGPRRHAWLAFRVLMAIVSGLAISAPWLLTPHDYNHSPRITGVGLALGSVGMATLPLLMFLAYAGDRSVPLGPRKALRAASRHPGVLAASIALWPLGALAAEGVTLALTSLFGWMPYMILELYPDTPAICRQCGVPYASDVDLGGLPDARFVRMYRVRLAEGYTLLGAMPHSLGLERYRIGFPWMFPMLAFAYTAQRVLYAHLMLCIVFLFLALQACWLGMLSRVETRT